MNVSFDELYQEILLDHYRHPRNQCTGEKGQVCVKHENPLCGDELGLAVEIDGDDRITDICFEGHGCSISQSSASMMTEAVKGLTRAEAVELIERVRRMMHGESDGEDLGDIEALRGVALFPVRIKCALLAWMALKDSLENVNLSTGIKHEHN